MQRQGGRGNRCQRTRAGCGFVLLELLFTIMIIVIAAIWLFAAYHSALHLAQIAQQTSLAYDDLKDMMERIKATPFTQLTANFPDGAVNGVVGGGPDRYGAVVGSYGLSSEQIVVRHQPSTTADPKELIVQISWTNQGRTYQKSVSTLRASKAS